MQVKIFQIDSPEKDINDFLDAHKVVENGIVVREGQIVVLYMKDQTEEEAKMQKLKNTLTFFREQFVGESINHAYYLKLEMLGKGTMQLRKEVQTPMGPSQVNTTVAQESAAVKTSVESLKVQILTLEEMIQNPPVLEEELRVFNQKQYKAKK